MDQPSTSTPRQASQARQVPARAHLPYPAASGSPHPRASAAAGPGTAGSGTTSSGTTAFSVAVYRAMGGRSLPTALVMLRRVARPRHRLTGLGTGVVTTAITMFGGAVDTLLFGGPGAFFGLVFAVGCALGALWVRDGDLAAAPISAPIAFAVALALTGTTSGGLVGHAMGTVTGLATHTSWLYFGTLLSASVVGARHIARRRAARR